MNQIGLFGRAAKVEGREDDRRFTPAAIVRAVESIISASFVLDVCAESTPGGHVCPRYLTAADDALSVSWAAPGEWAWCNPPFSRKDEFIARVRAEYRGGRWVALLLPFTADPSRMALFYDAPGVVMADHRVRYTSPVGANMDSPGPVVQAVYLFGSVRGLWLVDEGGRVRRPACSVSD